MNLKTLPDWLKALAIAVPLVLSVQRHALAQGSGTGGGGSGDEAKKDEPVFFFPGGTPRQFLEAVEKHFKADWLSIASIPREMDLVKIPKLRIPWEDSRGRDPSSLVMFYNHLASWNPQFGKLVVEGVMDKPSIVMFVPEDGLASAQAQRSKFMVRAFSLRGIPKEDWGKIREEIYRSHGEALNWASDIGNSTAVNALANGRTEIHDQTSLLVAYGPEGFVEMVESFVKAHQTGVSSLPKVESSEKAKP